MSKTQEPEIKFNVLSLSRDVRPHEAAYDPAQRKVVHVAAYQMPPVTHWTVNDGGCVQIYAGKHVIAMHHPQAWDTVQRGWIDPKAQPLAEVEKMPAQTKADSAKP